MVLLATFYDFLEKQMATVDEISTGGLIFMGFLAIIGVIPLMVVSRRLWLLIVTPTLRTDMLEAGQSTEVAGNAKSYDGEYYEEPFNHKKVIFYVLEAGILKRRRRGYQFLRYDVQAEGNQDVFKVADAGGEVILANNTFDRPLLGVRKSCKYWFRVPKDMLTLFPEIKEWARGRKKLFNSYYFKLYYLKADASLFTTCYVSQVQHMKQPELVLTGGTGSLSEFATLANRQSADLITKERRRATIASGFSAEMDAPKYDNRYEVSLGGQGRQFLISGIQMLVMLFIFTLFTVPFLVVMYLRFLA
ncbi:MAG: hypothetical protein AAFO69_04975 [Bacteroidota bacterium]